MVDILPKTRRPRRERAPTNSDPVDIAMEAESGDVSPDSPARRLLIKQERLVGWQIASERAGFALKVLTGLAGLILVGAVAAMAWSASQDESIVVQTFAAPPTYATRGLSGEVLAAKFSDRFREVQQGAAAGSLIAIGRLTSDAEKVTVEIPQAGISIGEVQRLLAQWLGHRKVISGELTETAPGQITVTARLAGLDAFSASGPAAEVDALLKSVAERAFGRAVPGQLSIYLDRQGRHDEALAVARDLALNPRGAEDRLVTGFYSIWSNYEDDPDLRLRLLTHGLAITPESLGPTRNLEALYGNLGHEQQAYDLAAKARGFSDWFQPGNMSKGTIRGLHDVLKAEADMLKGAFADAVDAGASTDPTYRERLLAIMARASARSHDARRAQAILDSGQLSQRISSENATLTAVYLAEAKGEGPAMLAALADYKAAGEAARPTPLRAKTWTERTYLPLLAEAQVLGGDGRGAMISVAATPLDCAPCLRARAMAAAASGDAAGADRWCALAVAAAPGLPAAETLWGRLLLERGQPDAAVAKLSAAVAKGPRAADPLEVWGEALVAKGDAEGAVRKFKAADRFAPNWGRNHLKWGQALAKLGKTEQAREQFKLAAGLDLSSPDRAELAKTPR